MQEKERRAAAPTGSWGLGFGIALAALALIAGWYVPRPSTPAAATATAPAVTRPATLANTPQPTADTPLPSSAPAAVSPTAVISAAPVLTPTAALATYTVQPGDTLSEIGAKLGVPQQEIVDANRLTEPDRLAEGQRLVIPKATDAR